MCSCMEGRQARKSGINFGTMTPSFPVNFLKIDTHVHIINVSVFTALHLEHRGGIKWPHTRWPTLGKHCRVGTTDRRTDVFRCL